MKVIAFNGSPHSDGVIQSGIEIMAGELASEGIATEIVQAGAGTLQGCIDCQKCRELGRCVFDGDLVNRAREMINEADGIIIGSPVYYGSIAGAFKCFLDRLFFAGLNLEFKAASALVSCRRSGGVSAFHQLHSYLNLSRAVIVPSVYWGVIHGNSREELEEDLEGRFIMESSGRSMAWLIKTLALGKKEIPLPPKKKRPWTNFIH